MDLVPLSPAPESAGAASEGRPELGALSPLEAGLHLITERLGVPAVLLFAADASGALRVVGAEGRWGDDALALRRLAESLDGGLDVLDARDAIEGARFAAGVRLGDGEGALLVLAPDDLQPDEAWQEAFAGAAQLALGLIRNTASVPNRVRLINEVAMHPGNLDVRLDFALERVAEVLGLDGAAFARTQGGTWTPEAVFDVTGRLVPTRPVPLKETFCQLTSNTDGTFVIEDAAASPLPIASPGCYIGAPVFVGGKCVGTFSVVGHGPRAKPFTEDDRDLIESLARWVGASLTGRDVARRLADREAALASFFDSAPMGMGVVRLVQPEGGPPDLQLLTVNAAAGVYLGGEPEALADRLASEAGIARPVLDVWVRTCREVAGRGTVGRFEFEAPGPDGTHVFATTVSRIASVDPDDHGARFTFVIEDVTLARTSGMARGHEAALDAVVSQAPVALFEAGPDGVITMSRGRDDLSDTLGLRHAVGAAVVEVFGGSAEAAEGLRQALAGSEAAWVFEANGQWVECRVRPALDADGLVAGVVGVALDVTDRERGARALARANRTVEGVSKARTAFLKHLNHELRSPLTSILGYAELLTEEAPPDEVVQVRDVIARSGSRLLSALDDLLDLTLLDGGDVTVNPTATNLIALVESVAEANRMAAEARRLSLNVWCLLPDEPLLLDGGLVERVVRHLVGGAIASATGSRVDVRLAGMGADWIELTVLGGAGDECALGIGPDLVYRLVEAMGGTVDEVQVGMAGWRVRLPRQRVPVVELGAAQARPTLLAGSDGADEAVSMAVPEAGG